MKFFKKIELFFRQKKNTKYDVSDLDNFLKSEMNIINITKKISCSAFSQQGPTVIYSTYCGSIKNKTFNAKPVASDVDHIFISNNETILRNAEKMGWKPCYIEIPVYENLIYSAFQAKIAKTVPHIFPFMEKYHFSMYLVDKLNFNTSLLNDFQQLVIKNNSPIAIRQHNFLKPTVLHEFSEAMRHKRYLALRDRTINYILHKENSGFTLKPENIFWTSAIFRDHQHIQIKKLNEQWYEDRLMCGINCQISFDFVAQKYPISIMPIKID